MVIADGGQRLSNDGNQTTEGGVENAQSSSGRKVFPRFSVGKQ
jgi:hypothetical protein